MLKKIIFKLDSDRYFVNIQKSLLIVSNKEKFTRKLYHLDNLHIGENWVVLEATLTHDELLIWDLEDLEIEFVYTKGK